METMTIIVVGNKFKVYRECGNGKRVLLGSFKTSHEAERFMNSR